MDNFDPNIYIEDKALFDYAASTARLMQPIGTISAHAAQSALKAAMSSLRRSHAIVEKRSRSMASPPAACCWLLDNMYIARREYIAALGPFRQAKKLRRCSDGILILCLCRSLVLSSRGKIDADRCRLFLDGFQSVTVLKRCELELFAAALKCALLEELAICANKLCKSSQPTEPENFKNIFDSLRFMAVCDMEKLIASADVSRAVLSADPTGDFPKMDSVTQALYLKKLSRLAKLWGMEEHKAAEKIIKLSKQQNRHIGFLLFEEKSTAPSLWYIGANFALTLSLSLYIALYFDSPAPALLLLLPISELVKNLMDFLLLHLIPPSPMPRMDTEKEIPPEGKSICVISALLTDSSSTKELCKKLEHFYLSSGRDDGLYFGILSDLKSAPSQSLPEDREIINSALVSIKKLNQKYPGRFFLFTRPRTFDGEAFSGFERKRGAITELAKLLKGQNSNLTAHGDTDLLQGINYIISLDSDTEIYPGSLRQLVGAMLHPLNRAVIDPESGRILGGHGIIQPRISNSLASCHSSDFAIIRSGSGGSDPYGSLCSELYMDAFSSGGFAGKGIINVDAFLACLPSRIPEGRVLSHDALEGAYLRGGFMGDTEFCDAFPSNPLDFYKRQHRWTRGDWQNAPWIFKKELPPIERWRLFDSLRRSLLPAGTLLALLLGFFLSGKAVIAAAWAALLAVLSSLILSLAEESIKSRGKNQKRLRRFTRVLTGVGAAIVQSFLKLWLLPFEAYINLSAACTALWRMFVSGKKLLQWQTAAQYKGGGFADHIKAMLPAEALGFLLLLFSPGVIGRASGLMWLISPAAAAALALPAKAPAALSHAHREYLKESLKGSWQYLKKFSSKEENFLPPDNFQANPQRKIAHRTSPTNMGFALSSAVAAADMGLCENWEAIDYIERLLNTLEKLPRCKGHFYNWYDTQTLSPLEPAYVSTVDSGNMYAGLLVCKNALSQWGENALSERVENLMTPMDFAPLFDKKRQLFYICYDSKKEQGAGGWYDLMASEALLTSYLAISKGDVPVKHWRHLSRAQLQQDGYRGLASWTGTMFEYLMPELFLPFYRGSLLWESGRFCLRAQKKRAFSGKPWGISESAFYSLDSALNYRYKAHGVPALALKRGQEEDMVISPYSTYLSLSVDPLGSLKNLRRLESFGALDSFGFIEALDFSPKRCRNSRGEKVSCYMAHHVGMSLMAGANALCEGSIVRRFMAEPCMAAHSLLLQEQIPTDPAVISRDSSPTQDGSQPGRQPEWKQRSQNGEEGICLLSNGTYHLLSHSSGKSEATLTNRQIYNMESFKLGFYSDNKYHSISPDEQPLIWEASEEEVKIKNRSGDISCQSSLSVAAAQFGELRTFRLTASKQQQLIFSLSFLPIMANRKDYVNHSAFWNLGLHAKRVDNFVLVRRLRRGEKGELWLCAGFDRAMESSTLGYLNGSALELRVPLKLSPAQPKNLRFALCLGESEEEAIEGARQILKGCDSGCMVSAAAARLEMKSSEVGAAMALLPHIFNAKTKAGAGISELWRNGISGDNPIISCNINAPEALPLLKEICLLKSCGVDTELVYLSSQQGEYHRPAHKLINDFLSKIGLDALFGSTVHILPDSEKEIIQSRSVYFPGKAESKEKPLPFPQLSEPRQKYSLPKYHWSEDSFNYYVNHSLPPRSWQHILSNSHFSAIVRDCGMAELWLENAREMPILRCDGVESVQSSECLYARSRGRSISLFAANDGLECSVSFGFGWASWEKELFGRKLKTTAFIPMEQNARVLIIEGAVGLELTWCMEPLMGPDSSALSCTVENGIFSCKNKDSYFEKLEFSALCSSFSHCRTDFLPAAMQMRFVAEERTVLVCGCEDTDALKKLSENAVEALDECKKYWLTKLSLPMSQSHTNAWAAYQTIACRLFARGSLYQRGGAYGFRDQLQDAVNMLLIDPNFAREQILLCCRHQYEEGDVMHWWHPHPDGDKGLRSRCSDDMLWLVWALCEYCKATGDYEICSLDVNYVNSEPLSQNEKDRYEKAETGIISSVLHHAKVAIDCCINRGFGSYGLPFFGSGDWNDGLDEVDGESVWLGCFLSICADKFVELLEKLCKPNPEYYRALSKQLAKAVDASWNGSFYRRGYLSDGSALGGEMLLDSLPQSFAAMNPHCDREKAKQAVKLCLEKLVDREAQIVKLFDPPYSADGEYMGYISSYGEGFRENGGQYTHGAVWLAKACFCLGMKSEGKAIMEMLLPENHDAAIYEAEPYVLPADVYSAQGHKGKAGWTWYTGSAGWYFSVACENIFGIKLENGRHKFTN